MRLVQDGLNSYSIYFCREHLDAQEEKSSEYLVFTTGSHDGYDYVTSYDDDTAPYYVKSLFGEADATTAHSGRLSATDKYRLDYLWDNYGKTATESQTKPIVTDFEPSEEEDESESNN